MSINVDTMTAKLKTAFTNLGFSDKTAAVEEPRLLRADALDLDGIVLLEHEGMLQCLSLIHI